MKKLLLAAALALVTTGPVMAQQSITVKLDPLASDRKGFYAGGNLGSNLDGNARITGGLDVGYQVMPYLRGELTYDYMWRQTGNGSTLVANAVGQYRVPNTSVTPYLLAGTGLGFNSLGSNTGYADSVYNVGGGVRFGLSNKVEMDVRYRYVGHFSTTGMQNVNLLTAGLNYRF